MDQDHKWHLIDHKMLTFWSGPCSDKPGILADMHCLFASFFSCNCVKFFILWFDKEELNACYNEWKLEERLNAKELKIYDKMSKKDSSNDWGK